MGQRPNLWDNVDTGEGSEPQAAEVVTIAPPATVKAKPVQSTLYLPPQAHRQLKEIAFAMDCKMHDLFIEGINHVLAKKGYGTVEELAKK